MARVDAATRKLLADLVAPIVEAHGGPTAVAARVGRHKSSVSHWTHGDIDFNGLRALASGLRTDVVLTFPAHGAPSGDGKESPPAWAEGLVTRDDLEELIAETVIPIVARQTVVALREAGLLPPAVPVPDTED